MQVEVRQTITQNGGSYPSRPKAELLEDGRIIMLLEDFSYIDPQGVNWTAPKGAQADGASIPRALWTVLGGPLEGRYRDASIIHDFYCSRRNKPWKSVHRVFYDAMITSRVSKAKAKLMYAGVYLGGPRWSDMDVHNTQITVSRLNGAPGIITFAPGASFSRRTILLGSAHRKEGNTIPAASPRKKAGVYHYNVTKKDLKEVQGVLKKGELELDELENLLDKRLIGSTPEHQHALR